MAVVPPIMSRVSSLAAIQEQPHCVGVEIWFVPSIEEVLERQEKLCMQCFCRLGNYFWGGGGKCCVFASMLLS